MKSKRNIKNLVIFICFTAFVVFFTTEYFKLKVPLEPPKLKIEVNGASFKAEKNGSTWVNPVMGSVGGNSSDLGGCILEKVKDIETIKVPRNSHIQLKLSNTKNIKSFSVKEAIGSDKDNYYMKDVEVQDYCIKAPDSLGNHVYQAYANWDSNHGVEFIFKVIVE